MKTILVTGGAGFIGSNYIQHCRSNTSTKIINVDKLTYAGNPDNLVNLCSDPLYIFVNIDICERDLLHHFIHKYLPDAIVHFAAESHVDKSILSPEAFIQTNIVGTFILLDEAKNYWSSLDGKKRETFRFHHISTDEVYGSLDFLEPAFTEESSYKPNSPYAASKAASDHLVRSYFTTYGLPTLITNCSNNYGPFQFPEKIIPLMILNALEGKKLPIYGNGENVRDWLFVEDHVEALVMVLEHGTPGETYNIGGSCEKNNLELVSSICEILDLLYPDSPYTPHSSLIDFVKDRPGHDKRYAVNTSKIRHELGWSASVRFENGLKRTISWYIDNPQWVKSVKTGEYRKWMKVNYENR